jgi:hypothetical protein
LITVKSKQFLKARRVTNSAPSLFSYGREWKLHPI